MVNYCVYHNKLWKILKEMGISDYLTSLLRNLYAGQEATVRIGYDLSAGSGVLFHSFLLPGTDKEQRIYEKQHAGILLLNVP